jgi:hypothetical protein
MTMVPVCMEETVVGTKEEEEAAAGRLTARSQRFQLGVVVRAGQLVAV